MELVPNFCGARLVAGSVRFDDQPPCARHVTVTEYPIIAFQPDGKRFIPMTLSGPVSFWGELRVSTVGALVYGVTVGGGIELPDGTRCASVAEFETYMITVVGRRVREVRTEKNWPSERLPTVTSEDSPS